MSHNILHLIMRQFRQHRHGNSPKRRDRKESDAPIREILGQYSHLVSGSYTEIRQNPRKIVRFLLELQIRIAFVPSDKFTRNAFLKMRCRIIIHFSKRIEQWLHFIFSGI